MDEAALVRRLTAIVAIDVVGFSAMSARDEERAVALLRERLGMAERIIAERRGRVFKTTGDGLLAEFASPVEAVRAAAENQQAMRLANQSAPADEQLQMRIGVNLGDVIEQGDDLMGDAVNVAVRLEALAAPGGICISRSVKDQMAGKLPWALADLGNQQVKNIPRPIRAYSVLLDGSSPPPVRRRKIPGAMALAGIAALVVVAAGGAAAYWFRPHADPAASVDAAAVPQPAAVAAAPRPFVAAEVPFVRESRRKHLEVYASAEGAKALAINIRGQSAFATRRVNDETAKRLALEECARIVAREAAAQARLNGSEAPAATRDPERCMLYAVGNEVVWTFRMPSMPATPYSPPSRPTPPVAFDPATAPLLVDKVRTELAETYLKATGSRAVALGWRRTEFWMPGDSDTDAMRRALQICGHSSGRPCFVLSLNGELVVRLPRLYRAVEVFTPQAIADSSLQAAIERYLVADDWRAVALGRNGKIGIASGRSTEAIAAGEALRDCARAGGTECAVTAIGPFLVAPR